MSCYEQKGNIESKTKTIRYLKVKSNATLIGSHGHQRQVLIFEVIFGVTSINKLHYKKIVSSIDALFMYFLCLTLRAASSSLVFSSHWESCRPSDSLGTTKAATANYTSSSSFMLYLGDLFRAV